MSDDDTLIRCESVSKRFCKDLRKSLVYGARDIGRDLFGGDRQLPKTSSDVQLATDEFWANQDISFELKRGQCLGLLGRNGSGKTTLLKQLNGLIRPDTGRIELRGSVGGLIALGAGFNPILTGRENILVNGSILGMSKQQISQQLDEIVEFAELSEFIDAPVQTYSSGMQVRLGFAISAVMMRPDILLLDEVLAVGDIGFRSKCYQAIWEMRHRAAVVFVTHNVAHVSRICDLVMHMEHGTGSVMSADEGTQAYLRQLEVHDSVGTRALAEGVELRRFLMTPDHDIQERRQQTFEFELQLDESIRRFELCLTITSQAHEIMARSISEAFVNTTGQSMIRYTTDSLPLMPGRYGVTLTVDDLDTHQQVFWWQDLAMFDVEGERVARPGLSLLGSWITD